MAKVKVLKQDADAYISRQEYLNKEEQRIRSDFGREIKFRVGVTGVIGAILAGMGKTLYDVKDIIDQYPFLERVGMGIAFAVTALGMPYVIHNGLLCRTERDEILAEVNEAREQNWRNLELKASRLEKEMQPNGNNVIACEAPEEVEARLENIMGGTEPGEYGDMTQYAGRE